MEYWTDYLRGLDLFMLGKLFVAWGVIIVSSIALIEFLELIARRLKTNSGTRK